MCKADPALCRYSRASVFDCTNPESNGALVVRKIEVDVLAPLDPRACIRLRLELSIALPMH